MKIPPQAFIPVIKGTIDHIISRATKFSKSSCANCKHFRHYSFSDEILLRTSNATQTDQQGLENTSFSFHIKAIVSI